MELADVAFGLIASEIVEKDPLIAEDGIVLVSMIESLECTLIGVRLNVIAGSSLARMAQLRVASLPPSNSSIWPSVVEINKIVLVPTTSDLEGIQYRQDVAGYRYPWDCSICNESLCA